MGRKFLAEGYTLAISETVSTRPRCSEYRSGNGEKPRSPPEPAGHSALSQNHTEDVGHSHHTPTRCLWAPKCVVTAVAKYDHMLGWEKDSISNGAASIGRMIAPSNREMRSAYEVLKVEAPRRPVDGLVYAYAELVNPAGQAMIRTNILRILLPWTHHIVDNTSSPSNRMSNALMASRGTHFQSARRATHLA
ncbi:uncharacterized protein CIMG_12949 [Coccidioides immitis RS]|uniref:Uncharacterized protein n=1 Tax=Coccidioides immitis (strain RS) TaxID=246410 RepID=A0A0D8JVW1_COCIM|nr:uncharacterized protein CIMG_12949 [Coccidioides immitis RS]KJF60418.1 hypothetical protein CIMG_12949 [Coccidioides immitis RS]